MFLSFILSDASATPLYWKLVWRKCALLTACEKEQQGLVLADEGPRGQQEGGRESRRFPFGTPYGTLVMETGESTKEGIGSSIRDRLSLVRLVRSLAPP